MFFSVGFNLFSSFLWIWHTPVAVAVDKELIKKEPDRAVQRTGASPDKCL
jgi:hypothetical protein